MIMRFDVTVNHTGIWAETDNTEEVVAWCLENNWYWVADVMMTKWIFIKKNDELYLSPDDIVHFKLRWQ